MPGSSVKAARRRAIAEGSDPAQAAEPLKRARHGARSVAQAADRVIEKLTELAVPVVVPKIGLRDATPREAEFVRCMSMGMSPKAAAKHAGYSSPTIEGPKIAAQPNIAAAVREQQAKWEEANKITKRMVFDGFMEAAQMAKLQSDPIVMVAAYREIGRMAGYYEPQKRELTVSVTGSLVVQRIQQLSDDQLLKLVEGEVIEGEVVPDGED